MLHTHAEACTRTRKHAHAHVCMHARICTHTYTHTHKYTQACTNPGRREYRRTHNSTHACMYFFSHTPHTHTHTHTHVCMKTGLFDGAGEEEGSRDSDRACLRVLASLGKHSFPSFDFLAQLNWIRLYSSSRATK